MTDRHVEAVRQKLLERSQVGLAKYGVNLERTDYAFLDWLKELQNEMLDGANYCQVMIDALEKNNAMHNP